MPAQGRTFRYTELQGCMPLLTVHRSTPMTASSRGARRTESTSLPRRTRACSPGSESFPVSRHTRFPLAHFDLFTDPVVGVPIIKVGRGKYFVERLPGALE